MSFAALAVLAIHDVKNRLAAMAARAETRGDRETLRDALAAAGELSRLLVCYKFDAGLLRPDIDAHCPAELVDDLLAEVRSLSGLALAADYRLAPQSWYYDESLVRMVLANALHNALRFARGRIQVSARQNGEWLEFEVSDDGPGYLPEMLTDSAPVGPLSASGVGLGLHLARSVACLHENHGLTGSLSLANAPGAVFVLRLPR